MELTGSKRLAGNMGGFYSETCIAIQNSIKLFTEQLSKVTNPKALTVKPRAIIAPHAGWVYSGFTANAAYKTLANTSPERIVVIGPSHHVYFEGVSAAFTQFYETPCGSLQTDVPYLEKLHQKFRFKSVTDAHFREHSTETQMPFIKHYFPHVKIVELIYGKTGWKQVAQIVEYILSDKQSALVISSDLSHFYPLHEAELLDAVCLNAIKHADLNLFDQGCEACGIIGIKALINTVSKLKLKTGIIDYRTSADASNDESRTVGYAAAAVW